MLGSRSGAHKDTARNDPQRISKSRTLCARMSTPFNERSKRSSRTWDMPSPVPRGMPILTAGRDMRGHGDWRVDCTTSLVFLDWSACDIRMRIQILPNQASPKHNVHYDVEFYLLCGETGPRSPKGKFLQARNSFYLSMPPSSCSDRSILIISQVLQAKSWNIKSPTNMHFGLFISGASQIRGHLSKVAQNCNKYRL
jgi:hypothetical protein